MSGINTSESELIQAAEIGHVDAMVSLGAMYRSGEGVKKNLRQAFFYYLSAAMQDDVDALYTVGKMYTTGEAIEYVDFETLKADIHKASLGDEDANWDLNLRSNAFSFQEARKWYERAKLKGCTEADFDLNCFLDIDNFLWRFESKKFGTGIEVYGEPEKHDEVSHDQMKTALEKVIPPLISLAELGHVEASYLLANIYRESYFSKLREESDRWMAIAAQRGHKDALEVIEWENNL